MRRNEIAVGMECRVRRGYSTRPAVVTGVSTAGVVSVRFTDVDTPEVRAALRTIPSFNRSYLYSASVRPFQVLAKENAR